VRGRHRSRAALFAPGRARGSSTGWPTRARPCAARQGRCPLGRVVLVDVADDAVEMRELPEGEEGRGEGGSFEFELRRLPIAAEPLAQPRRPQPKLNRGASTGKITGPVSRVDSRGEGGLDLADGIEHPPVRGDSHLCQGCGNGESMGRKGQGRGVVARVHAVGASVGVARLCPGPLGRAIGDGRERAYHFVRLSRGVFAALGKAPGSSTGWPMRAGSPLGQWLTRRNPALPGTLRRSPPRMRWGQGAASTGRCG
jgi:hypothetical protein